MIKMMEQYDKSLFCNIQNEGFYINNHCEYETMETFSPDSGSDSFWPQEASLASGSSPNHNSSGNSTSQYEEGNCEDVPNDFFDDFFNEEFVDGMINNINKDWIMKYDPLKHTPESSCDSSLISSVNSSVQYDERYFVGEENLPLLCKTNQRPPTNDEDSCKDDSNSDAISSEDTSLHPQDIETKNEILTRCMKTLEILEDFEEVVGYQRLHYSDTYGSPLRRIPIIRFQFTSGTIPFRIDPVFDALQEIGIIEKPLNLFDTSDNRMCCVNCQKFNATEVREKSVQCPDLKHTNDIGLQVNVGIQQNHNNFHTHKQNVDRNVVSAGITNFGF